MASERLETYRALARREQALDDELTSAARAYRKELALRIDDQLGPFDPRHLEALVEVPRERFVRPEDLAHALDDAPLQLDEPGLATISAPHAYLLSFRLLDLAEGDSLLELGSGSGYGAALAAHIVGPGRVVTIEIDPELAARARSLLGPLPNVTVLEGDAMSRIDAWGEANKVVCTFAVRSLPAPWLEALREGTVLVAPVGARNSDQRLVRVTCEAGEIRVSDHGAVRYVNNRGVG